MYGDHIHFKIEAIYLNFTANIPSSRNTVGQAIFTLECVWMKGHYLFQNAKLPRYL